MEIIDVLVVGSVVVELRMIVRFHKAARRKLVDERGNAVDGHGKIVRPRLHGAYDVCALGIKVAQLLPLAQELAQKALVLEDAADEVLFAVRERGKLKVDVRDHPAAPVVAALRHLGKGARRPVVPTVDLAPFFRRVRYKYQRLLRFVPRTYQRLRQRQHHGYAAVIVLKSVKV